MAGIVVLSDTHFSNRKQFGKSLTNAVWKGCNSRFHEIAYAVQIVEQTHKFDLTIEAFRSANLLGEDGL